MLKPITRLAWLVWFLMASVAVAETHKVRVSDPASAQALKAQGARLVADYGGYQLLETDSKPAAGLDPARVQISDELNFIRLNAGALDTRKPEVRARRNAIAAFSGKRLHLVHFAGPVKPEWIEALKQCGVRIVNYIPSDAYLVYGDAAALARLHSWAQQSRFVQWEGAYEDTYKIHPGAPRAVAATATGSGASEPGLYAVQLLEDTTANSGTLALIDQLRLEPPKRAFRHSQYLNLVVRLRADELDRVASRPEVISIQPYVERRKLDERQNQIVAGNQNAGCPTNTGYLSWLGARGFTQAQFTASGFVVDISDSGVDRGTNATTHFGLYTLGNLTQASRVVYSRLQGYPNGGSTLEACDGHGNINAHIIAGYSTFSGFPFTDAAGFSYGLGVCPFVKVGSSVIFDPDFFTDPDYSNLQSEAYHDGARISANSWGAIMNGMYDGDAQWYDALVRDAQPDGSTYGTNGNQEMVIVFAAGNSGLDGPVSMQSPATAKNVITVGASENCRSLAPAFGGTDADGNDGCTTPDVIADDGDDIADFSSLGPCADGRLKPDLVAPGTHITGGVAQAAASTNGTGAALSCFNASGVCALPGKGSPVNAYNYFPQSQEFYTVSSGTSHSAPAVAGACALLRQDFINHSLPPPSPAMTKACLMISARYLTGVGANDTLWSASQGMGCLDLGVTFDGVPRVLRDQVAEDKFTGSGQTRTFTGTIVDPATAFRVTLAWTDAPGSTTGNAYNNDLDLTVVAGGRSYKGNVFDGGISATGGSYDEKNNVESVWLPAGVTGNFKVTVTAANINSDGVPNEAPSLDQDFALVICNATSTPAPVLLLESAVLTDENCDPDNGAVDPGETVTLVYALKNVGNLATTNLVATLLTSNGVYVPSPPRTYGALAPDGGAVTQAFTFTAIGNCGDPLQPVLQLTDGPLSLGKIGQSLILGLSTVTTNPYPTLGLIPVPGSGTIGVASPYPSTVVVSGITNLPTKVLVTLLGVTHSFPDDMDILLVGPSGTNVLLMSFCGGGNPVTNLTLTFDPDAPTPVPDGAPLVSGRYRPAAYDGGSTAFEPPAPFGPFGTSLTAFSGLDPNGTWSLYAQDHASGDSGAFSNGWQLSVVLSNVVCCVGAPPAPPTVQSIALSNSTVIVTWPSIPGQSYRLQSVPELDGSNWNTLWPDVVATNGLSSKSSALPSPTQSFYRLILLP